MRETGVNVSALVVAAQAGDRRALDHLVSAHLPLVYTIVRRALGAHPDADDVVQEVMLRALRELRELRTPESFRAWLAAIAVRQVSTFLGTRHRAARRTTSLEDIVDAPDAGADFANLTALRLDLSNQRGQVVRASRWLDPDDWALLSLWWLEVAGQLTRAELAEALDVSVAHAGVRVQRMRTQLEVCRSVVAALEAYPRCDRLDPVAAAWDGLPSPLWRKRIARHVRSCSACARAADGGVGIERLFLGVALLPVPAALSAALLGKLSLGTASASLSAAAAGVTGTVGVGAKAGLLTQLSHAVLAHPIAATVVAGTIVAGAAITTTHWPTSPPPAPTVAVPTRLAVAPRPTPTRPGPSVAEPSRSAPPPAPAPTPSSLAPGSVSLEAANETGFFVSTVDTYGVLAQAGPTSDSQSRQRATFEVVAGLADPDCFSFRLPDGQYLRHSSWRLRVFAPDDSDLFRGDATFCVRSGTVPGSVALESSNYPGWFLRHRGDELWVDHDDGTAAFDADGSFVVRTPLSG